MEGQTHWGSRTLSRERLCVVGSWRRTWYDCIHSLSAFHAHSESMPNPSERDRGCSACFTHRQLSSISLSFFPPEAECLTPESPFHYCLSGRKGTALPNLCAASLLFTITDMPLLQFNVTQHQWKSDQIDSDWRSCWLSRHSGVLLTLSWWAATQTVSVRAFTTTAACRHSITLHCN